MKPDLRATAFSRQNAYFFARLSVMAYKEHSEVEGFLAGNSTSKGLGFDRFQWFEVGMCTHDSLFFFILNYTQRVPT